MTDQVILVDENDADVGQMEKLEAHKKGLLHRAFSVLIFNDNDELLLQQRAFGKYHSEGLWTNTCCSHPSPNENILDAGKRRLKEEMGMDCELYTSFDFIYKAELDNNLTEYELDHVLFGRSNDAPILNTEEALSYKWMTLSSIQEDILNRPDNYTVWFKILILQHFDKITLQLKNESLQKRNV